MERKAEVAHYYLVAGLPDLVFGERPEMSLEEFRGVCDIFLAEEESRALFTWLDGRVDAGAPGPLADWADMDIQIKNAVARALARKAGQEPARYERPHGRYFAEAERVAAEALNAGDPLDRESSLDRGRFELAEELAVGDPFGFAAVAAYGIRLMIAWRWAEMDHERGGEIVNDYVDRALARYAGTAS
jgi:hypothetical protein